MLFHTVINSCFFPQDIYCVLVSYLFCLSDIFYPLFWSVLHLFLYFEVRYYVLRQMYDLQYGLANSVHLLACLEWQFVLCLSFYVDPSC